MRRAARFVDRGARFDTAVRFDVVRFDVARFDVVRFDAVRFDVARFVGPRFDVRFGSLRVAPALGAATRFVVVAAFLGRARFFAAFFGAARCWAALRDAPGWLSSQRSSCFVLRARNDFSVAVSFDEAFGRQLPCSCFFFPGTGS